MKKNHLLYLQQNAIGGFCCTLKERLAESVDNGLKDYNSIRNSEVLRGERERDRERLEFHEGAKITSSFSNFKKFLFVHFRVCLKLVQVVRGGREREGKNSDSLSCL